MIRIRRADLSLAPSVRPVPGNGGADAPARNGDFLTRTLDLPLETVILLVGGMALAIAGALLFPIASGALPYYEDGLFGLLLVVFALQTITMGKTPFGDVRRSRALVAAGVALASIGIVSLQALAIGAHVGRFAAKYGTRFIVPVCDQTMLPITEQVLRETYSSEGKADAFRPDDIRFLSDRQFAYAAGVTGIMHQEKVAATFMFGQFYAESLILAENGQAVGAIQVAGTPDLLQTPFFVVTCDYTIIGDEYYAASAYLSREPTQLGSLSGQDIAKVILFALVIAGIVWTIFQPENPMLYWMGGGLPQYMGIKWSPRISMFGYLLLRSASSVEKTHCAGRTIPARRNGRGFIGSPYGGWKGSK